MLARVKTSHVSTINPSSPFLIQRLLRSPAPRVLYFPQSKPCWAARFPALAARSMWSGPRSYKKFRSVGEDPSRSHKSKSKEEHKQRKLVNDETLRLLLELRRACSVRNLKLIMDMYPSLLETRALAQGETFQIAGAIHAVVRNLDPAHISIQSIYPFVQRLVEDIKAGSLPPHPFAHVHLLGTFKSLEKYEDGYAFWRWLLHQDASYVSPSVYGAAIELMVYGGEGSLPEWESLYAVALKRFPGTFAAYHLSPNAIIPNRDQPVAMTDLPIFLLQGILTARIKSGDWKNAYLALDTALRLYPNQVPMRFFELFMTERPLEEAYTAYLVACRAGIVFKPSHLTHLVSKIRNAMATSASLNDRMLLLRAIANALYAYLEAGGKVEGVHIGALIAGFENVFPEEQPDEESVRIQTEYRKALVSVAHQFVSQLLHAGMTHSRFFTALISLAGSQRVPGLLHATLQDAQVGKIDLGDVGRRIILKSAGMIQDSALLEQYWAQIVTSSEEEGQQINYDDWITFAKACKIGDQVPYCREQMSHLEHTIGAGLRWRLERVLEKDEVKQEPPFVLTGENRFAFHIQELRDQLNNIATVVMSGQPMDLKKTPFYMSIQSPKTPLGTLEDLRIVYDEFTVDPHQPPQETKETKDEAVPSASTGIPLGELRFQNWVSIVEMMNQAQRGRKISSTSKSFPANERLPLPLDALRSRIQELRTPSPITLSDKVDLNPTPFTETKLYESDSPHGSFPPAHQVQSEAPMIVKSRLSRRPLKKLEHPLGLQLESKPTVKNDG